MRVQIYGEDIQFIVIYDEDVSGLISHLRELVTRGIRINIVFHERFISITKKLSRRATMEKCNSTKINF